MSNTQAPNGMFHLLLKAPQDTVCEMCEFCTAKNGTPETDNQGQAALNMMRSEVKEDLPDPCPTQVQSNLILMKAFWLSFYMFMP